MTSQIVCGTQIDIDKLPNRQSIVDVRRYLCDLVRGSDFKIVESGDRRLNYREMEYYLSYDLPNQITLDKLGEWIEKINLADIQKNFEDILLKIGQTKEKKMIIQSVYHF